MFIFYDLFRIISYKVKRRIAVYKRNLFKKIDYADCVNLLDEEIYLCKENEKLLYGILKKDIILIQLKAENFLRRLLRSW